MATLGVLVSALALVRGGAAGKGAADAAPGAGASGTRICVEHDLERTRAKITIEAEGNRVAWADVARALARAQRYDDSALEGVLPKGSFDISGKRWRRTQPWLNLALWRGVHFETEEPQGARPRLVITLDRTALLASERRFKAVLRAAVLSQRPTKQRYGLILPEGWQKTPAAHDLVILVHGLDSYPERLESLAAEIRGAGLVCGSFRYPNDRAVAKSARGLMSGWRTSTKSWKAKGMAPCQWRGGVWKE
jgi:hypothetical protein